MGLSEAHSIDFRAGEIGALAHWRNRLFSRRTPIEKLFVFLNCCIDKLTSSVKCN